MNKLLTYFVAGLIFSSVTNQVFANFSTKTKNHLESINNVEMSLKHRFTFEKKITKVDKRDYELMPTMSSKLFSSTVQYPEPFAKSAIQVPFNFKPNLNKGHLIDIESIGIRRIDVKIYNNWGVKVAESSLYNIFNGNLISDNCHKKVRLRNNELKIHKEMKDGKYYYVLEIHNENGDISTKEGEISLSRTQKK